MWRLELTQSVTLRSGRTTQVRPLLCAEGLNIEPEGSDQAREVILVD